MSDRYSSNCRRSTRWWTISIDCLYRSTYLARPQSSSLCSLPCLSYSESHWSEMKSGRCCRSVRLCTWKIGISWDKDQRCCTRTRPYHQPFQLASLKTESTTLTYSWLETRRIVGWNPAMFKWSQVDYRFSQHYSWSILRISLGPRAQLYQTTYCCKTKLWSGWRRSC